MSENALSAALRNAAARGDAWARIREGDRTTTVATLDCAASDVATELLRSGVTQRARVGLVVENTSAHIAALFGIWRAGAVAVPLNPRLLDAEADALLAHVGATARLEVDAGTGAPNIQSAPGADEGEDSDDEPDAVVAYTSGTTGRPKGVRLTHVNMLAAAMAVARTRRDGPESVAVVASPLCHNPVFVSHYLARLLTGGTLVLGGFEPARVARVIREQGVTDLPLVPAMIEPLLASGVSAASSLAKVTVGSAVTPMHVKEALAERFPNAEILEAYGQTESTDGLTMTTGREALIRAGTVGRAHASFEIGVRRPDGAASDVGGSGEVVARGPMVMRGYWNDSAQTEAALRDGWLHTGDLGRIDADGFLYITGRLKEIVITGGENVSPEEVEVVLSRHPDVRGAVVFGTPHERWGEQVTVAVISDVDIALDDLREFARPHLAGFKLPRALVRVREFPRTSAGKVRRGELRDRYAPG
ncbi:MAG: AMP-binding protein [Candidatus Binatia bacterium]|nr:AMP-binding protein [Candidatus Binatia bacterium]